MSTMETILIYKFHTGLDTKGAICVTANFNCLKIQVESTSLCIDLDPANLLQKSMSDNYFFKRLIYSMILLIKLNSYIKL